MKKILLSLFVITTFLAYSIHEKDEANEAMLEVPKAREITPRPSSAVSRGMYKNGTYTGTVEDVFYGFIEVQAVISGGRLSDIVLLQYPNDRKTSIQINEVMIPILRQEAIVAQSAEVDIVSGATESSIGFRDSLKAALAKAR